MYASNSDINNKHDQYWPSKTILCKVNHNIEPLYTNTKQPSTSPDWVSPFSAQRILHRPRPH